MLRLTEAAAYNSHGQHHLHAHCMRLLQHLQRTPQQVQAAVQEK
jgi:hypothetical protein